LLFGLAQMGQTPTLRLASKSAISCDRLPQRSDSMP
jgi:hypothetical protein